MPNPTSLVQRFRPALVEGLFALAVALLVYGVSCALVWPKPENVGFGTEWQRMSIDPFELKGLFPHRILSPLFAWAVGMGGPHHVVFMRGMHVVMLALVCLYARRLGTARFDAALVVLAIGVTAPVQMYKWHWVGYCDPLSYSLFLIAAMCVRHTAVFWILLLLNLTTHELAVFLVPWLWFLRRQQGASWRVDLAWLGGVLATYAGFYLFVRANAVQHTYSYDFFVENPLLPWGAVAIWAMTLTHWMLAFGPVLAVLAWHQHTAANGRERWQLWLVIAGIIGILGIAFDWMRHGNLLLLPFVLASARFLQAGHRIAYALLVAASTAMLWFHPPWDAGGEPTRTLWEQIKTLVIAPQPTDFFRVITDWIPAVWPTLLWVYALLAAVWVVGFAIARRDARAARP